MSKDELNPQRVMQTLQQWKEQKAMIKGRVDQMLNDADSMWAQKNADLINNLLGENQKLKAQLDQTMKLVPEGKKEMKPEMPEPEVPKKSKK